MDNNTVGITFCWTFWNNQRTNWFLNWWHFRFTADGFWAGIINNFAVGFTLAGTRRVDLRTDWAFPKGHSRNGDRKQSNNEFHDESGLILCTIYILIGLRIWKSRVCFSVASKQDYRRNAIPVAERLYYLDLIAMNVFIHDSPCNLSKIRIVLAGTRTAFIWCGIQMISLFDQDEKLPQITIPVFFGLLWAINGMNYSLFCLQLPWSITTSSLVVFIHKNE
jgi:hypothetical protein